jgi:hypothetical protein
VASSRHLVLLAGLLAIVGCDWDAGQFVFHPSVEQRVRESLALPAPGPVPVNPDSFSFALFGDPQVHADSVHRLGRFAADVRERGIALFAVLGDLTHDATESQLDFIKAALDSVGAPYYVTAGNHDLYQAGGWERFRATFGPATYSVVIADKLKLIFLDSASGTLGPTQLDWLEAELDDGGRHTKIVGTHYPLYDGSAPVIWRLGSTAERMRLLSMLRDHGAWAYASGHIHGWRHTEVSGTHHFICGSMAPGALDYGTPGYLLLTFAHDSLAWQKIDIE